MMTYSLMKKPAKEVRETREKFNLSREEFAHTFGLSGYRSVMNIETAFRKPSKLTLILLRALNSLPIEKAKQILELLRKHADH